MDLKKFGVDELEPLIDEELINIVSAKAAVCNYEGCGVDDSWPRAK